MIALPRLPARSPDVSHGRLVPILTLCTLITGLQTIVLGPLLPAIAADLDTSVALLGQIPASVMFMAALIGFVAGPLADRVGHHRVLIASLVAVAASAVGMALAPGYWPLFAATLLGAFGRAIVQPIAVVIVGERLSGERQRRGISWVMAGMSGAVLVGIPMLTTVADTFGWRIAIGCLAMVTALLIPAVRRGLGPTTDHNRSGSSLPHILDAYQPLIRHRPTFGLILATLLGNAGHWVTMTYLGAFLAERHGYTTQQIGLVYLVPGTALCIGYAMAGGRITGLPLRPLATTTRTMVGACLAGVVALSIPALAAVSLLGVMAGMHAIALVAVVLLLMQGSPTSRATTITLNTVALSLGQALGAMLGGLMLSLGDFPLLGLYALTLSGTAALLIWITRVAPIAPPALPVPLPTR